MDITHLADIEYTIIGGMLYDPDSVGVVMATLQPADFTASKAARGLFEAIYRLYIAGAPIDEITLLDEAGADYAPAIHQMRNWVTQDLPHYCEMLQTYSKLAAAQNTALAIASADRLDEISPMLDELNGLMLTQRSASIVSAGDAAARFVQRMTDEPPEYLKWGHSELDEQLHIKPGKFVVIGGYPSAGKTALSLQFGVPFAEKYRVGYFSLETDDESIADRMMSHMAQIPLKTILRRELNQDEFRAVAGAAEKMRGMHFDTIRAAGMSVRDIQAVALSRRYQVIFVDYLQLIRGTGKTRVDQVTSISMDLHTLAQQHGITVIALAQLSRPEKTAGGKDNGQHRPPTMASLRESGQIEQDADAIMLLYQSNPNDNRSNRILKVAKNKEGERPTIELAFDGARQTFTAAPKSFSDTMREIKRIGREEGAQQQTLSGFVEIKDTKGLPF